MYGKVKALLAALNLADDHQGEVYISLTATKAVVTFVPELPKEKVELVPVEMRSYTTLINDGDQSIITIQN